MQPHLYPRQPPPPSALFSSNLPTSLYSPSCTPSQFSHSATVNPHLQPHYLMPGSSSTHGTHHSYKFYQPQDHVSQYQNRNSTRTHSPYGPGVTSNLPPMRPIYPTVMQHPMPYQQLTNKVFSRSFNSYSSFNWPSSISHPRFYTGLDSWQNNMLLDSVAISSYPFVPTQQPIMLLDYSQKLVRVCNISSQSQSNIVLLQHHQYRLFTIQICKHPRLLVSVILLHLLPLQHINKE